MKPIAIALLITLLFSPLGASINISIDVPQSVKVGEELEIKISIESQNPIASVSVYVSYTNSSWQKVSVSKSDSYRVATYIPDVTGELLIKVVVTDSLGNTAVKYASVNVVMNYQGAIIAIAILALLAALLYLVARKRRFFRSKER